MVRDVEARLAAIEARLAIFELEGSYARHFDSRNGSAWAALFTPDGIYQARDATPDSGLFVQGRDALAHFCSTARFDGMHLLHQPQLDMRDDVATGRVHLEFVGLFHGSGAPSVRMIGYYDIAYVRQDGQWLIDRRVTTTFARADNSTAGYPADSGIPG